MLLQLLFALLFSGAFAAPSVFNCLEYSTNLDGSPGPCRIWSDAANGNHTISDAYSPSTTATSTTTPTSHGIPSSSGTHTSSQAHAPSKTHIPHGNHTTNGTHPNNTDELAAVTSCQGRVNGPLLRACWKKGFNISTDFDVSWPSTGVTRKYSFEITNGTAAPDGTPRITFLINGQYPGPTIFADWGDFVEVTVTNSLQNNGTGIHWHGLRQLNSNWEDGVPGLTECPLAPGQSKVYRWQATQYGTSWYHSHVGVQYGDGVVGMIVINGPTTVNYNEDLGVLPVSDWYYQTASARAYVVAHTFGRPPTTADNGLINGTMVSKSGTGKYAVTTMTKGKKYKLRLINAAVDNHFVVSLDKHQFTVVAADFVPIKPFTTTNLFIAIGQRYDVIINANQAVGNYWFRAEVQDRAGPDCGLNANNGNIKSIFRYQGAPAINPQTTGPAYQQRCSDEVVVPYWDSFVPSGPLEKGGDLDVAIDIGVNSSSTLVQWGINTVPMNVNWDKPILGHVVDGNQTFDKSQNVITLSEANQWYYWVVQEVPGTPISINIPHPMHLHGHDFYVLGVGAGNFSPSGLNYNNPIRRDTAMLPAGGWVAVAFKTDNPGAWLMHCHIAWHVEQGMAVQFLETANLDAIESPASSYQEGCTNWNTYYPNEAAFVRGPGNSGL